MTDDRTFLLTDWTFTVEEVLKDNPTAHIAAGSTITVTEPGGTLAINGRTVRAIERNFHSFERNGRYLLFLGYSPVLKTYKARAENGYQLADKKVVRLTSNSLYPELESKDAPTLLIDARAAAVDAADNPYCAGGAKHP